MSKVSGKILNPIIALCSVAISIGIISCGTVPPIKYVDLEGKGTIALVSYSLDKSIVERGDNRDEGPGLLQKAIKKDNAESDYYEDQINALNGIYDQFKSQINDIFGNVPCLDMASVTGNEIYKTEAKYEPKLVLGKDIAPGADFLNPADLNYLAISDTAKLNRIAKGLNADLLLKVESSAEYALSDGGKLKLGNLSVSAGKAKLYVTTRFCLYDPNAGVIIDTKFTNESDEGIPMVSNFVKTSNFPQCALSAHQKNVNDFKSYLQMQKDKAKLQATTASAPAK